MSQVSIIIPVFNHKKMTERCIDSIINNTLADFEIVIVDNGSEEQISDTYKKKVVYHRLDKNIFFAAGCNFGATKAQYSNLCFLNNDTLVHAGWDDCVEYLDNNPNVGLVGPKLLYPNNTIQHAGVQILGTNINGNVFDHRYRHQPSNFPPANQVRGYQSITGACIFIRKADWEQIGGFNTDYHNGYEDSDLCFKVRFNLHKDVVYYPVATVTHLESVTSSKVPYQEGPNKQLFFNLWGNDIKEDKSFWDRVDAGVVEKKNPKLGIFFWCSGAELKPPFKPDKFRPEWYNKKKCFKSLFNAAKNANVDVHVIYDGDDNEYSKYIQSHDLKSFKQVHHGNALGSIKELHDTIYSMIDVYEHFYIAEDDYLYLPESMLVLLNGIETIGSDKLFTLYDHPDRYTRTDDLTFNQESIALTGSGHWRTCESTCYSFCLNRHVLKNFEPQLREPLADRNLFRLLYANGIRLWSPMPGRATHLNSQFLTPLINWDVVNQSIQE